MDTFDSINQNNCHKKEKAEHFISKTDKKKKKMMILRRQIKKINKKTLKSANTKLQKILKTDLKSNKMHH